MTKIIDRNKKEMTTKEVIQTFCGVAFNMIIYCFYMWYISQFVYVRDIDGIWDELDHINLGKIDFYHHTDYERDLLVATIMRRK